MLLAHPLLLLSCLPHLFSSLLAPMATSRLARFAMEVAPPQFITVMRHRTTKMLDTISEEERDASTINSASKTATASATATAAASNHFFQRGSRTFFRLQ